ncbi:hypothetical protein C8R46DRAFT_1356407 [Mycena filopes]|nr:hypothetical protein C8R46DRAFT_1356407 [Mycena filopes]
MTVHQPAASAPVTAPASQPTQIVIPADETESSTAPTTINFESSSSSGAARVKPRQRNSASRRASHNAVERARRENLNARFLDLAALLPNLANIRRPSKSSIVNTCIAHVHASRRHRFLASQQLRALKEECDSLRREVNEWRERAGGIMLLPPPNRGEAFAVILAGAEFELDEEQLHSGEGEEEDGYGYGEDDGGGHHQNARYAHEDLGRLETQYSQEELARLEFLHHHQQRQQLEAAHHHAQHAAYGHGHGPAHHFHESPFAHDLSPPRSAQSAGFPDVPWRHNNNEHDHPGPPRSAHSTRSARSAHSAHEPVMTHPYMRIVPSQHPHEQYEHPQPHHPGQQPIFFHDDVTPKWEFVDEHAAHALDRRPRPSYRHDNW